MPRNTRSFRRVNKSQFFNSKVGIILRFIFAFGLVIAISAYLNTTKIKQQGWFFNTGVVYISSEADSIKTIKAINEVRAKYGRAPLTFDKRVYELALARAKDINKYQYYDHTNPKTGNCADTMKGEFSLSQDEYVAENLMTHTGGFSGFQLKQMQDTIQPWLDSRGHRYNLLNQNHTGGAVACVRDVCVFLGLNNVKYGAGCHIAEEGLKFFEGKSKLPDEI